MMMSKKYLRSFLFTLCIAGAGFTAVSILSTSSAFAADEKKEDKGEKVAVDKLPKPVVDAVKKDMPGSRITKAFKKAADGKTLYMLDDVKVGKKGWDLTVNEEGKIVKKEECHEQN